MLIFLDFPTGFLGVRISTATLTTRHFSGSIRISVFMMTMILKKITVNPIIFCECKFGIKDEPKRP